jgi:hypothetical protein
VTFDTGSVRISFEITAYHVCETWFLKFRTEPRFRLTENRALRGISGPKKGRKGQEDGDKYIFRSFIICRPNLTRHYYGNQIKGNELDGACSTHGRDEKCAQNFSQKT